MPGRGREAICRVGKRKRHPPGSAMASATGLVGGASAYPRYEWVLMNRDSWPCPIAAGGDLLEVELDEPGVVVAVAALRHLEDLGAQVSRKLAPDAARLAPDEGLHLGEVRSAGTRPLALWIEVPAAGIGGRHALSGEVGLGLRLASLALPLPLPVSGVLGGGAE